MGCSWPRCSSQYAEQYVEFSNEANRQQISVIGNQFDVEESVLEADIAENEQFNTEFQERVLQYFNFLVFLTVPVYALISRVVFGREQNYAEHLVINCYIAGITFLIASVLFVASLLVHPLIYGLNMFVTIVYYLYAYTSLNRYSAGRVVVKFFKFLGIAVLAFILAGIGGAIAATLPA